MGKGLLTSKRVEGHVRSLLLRSGLTRQPLVVAVSGGPDSLTLLHVLWRLRVELGLRLHAAHLDHGLRGAEAEEDARFVEGLCQELDLPVIIHRADVAAYRREHKLSLEEAAREVRYAFLAQVARQVAASAIALGHTADDQAETVLLHILRGSGIHGLRGMQPLGRWRDDQGELLLVRPLLTSTRRDTEAYCREMGLAPRVDSSNVSMRFTRNRLRLELLPALKRYNPRVDTALLRLAEAATQMADLLEQEVSRVWGSVVKEEDGALRLDAAAFAALSAALQRHILQEAYRRLAGNAQGLTERHLLAMCRALAGSAGKRVRLPRGLALSMGYGAAVLGRQAPKACRYPTLEGEHHLAAPGETLLPGWRVKARLLDGPVPPEQMASGMGAHLDADAVGHDLRVRVRRHGDRFQPLGMTNEKKLQDFLVDARVPRDWRDDIPLVVSGRGIAWVAGQRIAHWARVTPATQKTLWLEFEPGP